MFIYSFCEQYGAVMLEAIADKLEKVLHWVNVYFSDETAFFKSEQQQLSSVFVHGFAVLLFLIVVSTPNK